MAPLLLLHVLLLLAAANPFLSLFEQNYLPFLVDVTRNQTWRTGIAKIEYATHTVAVTDAAAGCPRLQVNLTIDYASSWLRLTPSDSNITFLYNCSKNASLSSYAVELSGCAGDAGESSYVLPGGVATGAEAYEYGCEKVVVAPVLEVHRRVMAAPPPANGSLLEVLQGGFELAYNAHSRQCDGCERSGGWCGYRRNDTHGGRRDGVTSDTQRTWEPSLNHSSAGSYM
ncbi:hypothetical protein ACP4OV_030276 [Aristida adscensionis]